jgi:hypothetical protein
MTAIAEEPCARRSSSAGRWAIRTRSPGLVAMLGSLLTSTFRHEAGLALLEPAVSELLGDGRRRRPAQAVSPSSPSSRGRTSSTTTTVRAVEVADRALEAGERLDLAPDRQRCAHHPRIGPVPLGPRLRRPRRDPGGDRAGRRARPVFDGLARTAEPGRAVARPANVLSRPPRLGWRSPGALGLRGFLRTLVGELGQRRPRGGRVGEAPFASHRSDPRREPRRARPPIT